MRPIPIGVFCSDLHLCLAPPLARRDEPDWMWSQEKMLRFINNTAHHYGCGVYVSGDIFHKARAHQSVERLAIEHMKTWNGIPGQHDLPNHDLGRIQESSFGVLMEAGFSFLNNTTHDNVHGFPWNSELKGAPNKKAKIAMIHQMVWSGSLPYPGAPMTGNYKKVIKQLPGFEVIVSGDNHKPFVETYKGVTFINCGSTMRRTADQEDHIPCCYVVNDDSTVEVIPIPIKDDVFSRDHVVIEKEKDDRISAFVDSLGECEEIDLSYEKNLQRYIEENNVGQEVQALIWRHKT